MYRMRTRSWNTGKELLVALINFLLETCESLQTTEALKMKVNLRFSLTMAAFGFANSHDAGSTMVRSCFSSYRPNAFKGWAFGWWEPLGSPSSFSSSPHRPQSSRGGTPVSSSGWRRLRRVTGPCASISCESWSKSESEKSTPQNLHPWCVPSFLCLTTPIVTGNLVVCPYRCRCLCFYCIRIPIDSRTQIPLKTYMPTYSF